MKVVVDTNILVSGLMSPFGAAGEVVRLLLSGALVPCLDTRILLEYREVLARPEFRIGKDEREALFSYLEATGERVSAAPLGRSLPDPDDEAFLATALAGGAACIVTYNVRHYPADCRGPIRVLTPREFLAFFRKGPSGGA